MTTEALQSVDIERDTAASHMVSRIPRATAATSVSDVIESLRGKQFECADTVFVTDAADRLEGIVRINDLFADSERLIGEIMEPKHEAVHCEDDQEQIAVLAMQLEMIAVPVVDSDARLVGAVPPEALFRILRAEHMEDLQRLAGIAPHEEGPVVALNAPLLDRFRRRIPWLIFGLFASSVITLVMAGFEQSLTANMAVAFFVPALVYIAGAIGTQAVSVAVRGLSAEDVSIKGLLRDELVIGLAIGATLGLISSIMVFVAFGDSSLSLAVGLAVLGGGAISATVGFGLPWVFKNLGSDPALGSGPVCTIIQDVASLLIYFGLVSVLVI
ncbi:MAG: magnesium transporter [Gammaproteobacteria bacterium]|nr:MAG: magnesium transporter [Gammaproteobacteria bacterium]RLA33655.1 MAG: magnesium transporter [Gammaproteobacteria bacterium]